MHIYNYNMTVGIERHRILGRQDLIISYSNIIMYNRFMPHFVQLCQLKHWVIHEEDEDFAFVLLTHSNLDVH